MDVNFAKEVKKNFEQILVYLEENGSEEQESSQLRVVGSAGDDVDVMNRELEWAFNMKLKKRNKYYAQKINLALKKIENGTYGKCEDCGEAISQERLRARPTAQLCICCKEQSEIDENQTFQLRVAGTNIVPLNANPGWEEFKIASSL